MLEKIHKNARMRFLAFALMVTPAGLEACAPLRAEIGRGALSGISSVDRPDDPNLPNYEQMLSELKQVFGEEYIASMLLIHERYHKRLGESVKTRYGGLENLDVSEQSIDAYVKETQPQSWINWLGTVVINPKLVPIHYPGLQGKAEFGHCAGDAEGNPITVEFTHENLSQNNDLNFIAVQEVANSLAHELAHAGDWSKNRKLTAEQSLIALYQVYKLVSSPDRPKFAYVESIKAENQAEKQQERVGKITEYFAELFAEALTLRNAGHSSVEWREALKSHFIKKLHASPEAAQRNIDFIEQYLAWSDPNFKPWEATQRKDDILEKMYLENIERRLNRDLDQIQDQVLRQALKNALTDSANYPSLDVYYQIRRVTGKDDTPNKILSDIDSYYYELPIDIRKIIPLSFSTILESIVYFRARRQGITDFAGSKYEINHGNNTVKEFNREFNQLSPVNKQKIETVLINWVQTTKERVPEDIRVAVFPTIR